MNGLPLSIVHLNPSGFQSLRQHNICWFISTSGVTTMLEYRWTWQFKKQMLRGDKQSLYLGRDCRFQLQLKKDVWEICMKMCWYENGFYFVISLGSEYFAKSIQLNPGRQLYTIMDMNCGHHNDSINCPGKHLIATILK